MMKKADLPRCAAGIRCLGLILAVAMAADAAGADQTWPGNKSSFHSFDQYNFKTADMNCRVVVPNEIADGRPWIWRAPVPAAK